MQDKEKKNSFVEFINKKTNVMKNIPKMTNSDKPKEENSKSQSKYLGLIIKVLLWFVIFALPLFFLTGVPSILELNKQLILASVVGIAFLIWVGKMAIKSQIKFRANFIFIPVFVFLVIMGLSTIFADYKLQSLWGFLGGEARSFISLVFLVALFVLIVNHIKTKKDITITLLTILVSGFLVTVYAVLQLWGKFILPIPITHTVAFNTIGSVYLLSIYVGILFLLTVTLLITSKKIVSRILLGVLAVFFFGFLIIFINFKLIWIALIIALALMFGRFIIGVKGTGSSISSVILMFFLVLSSLVILQKTSIIKKSLPTEILLTQKTSLNIAWQAVKKDVLLGSGPANYINIYRLYRPDNLGDFWSINFNLGSSYFSTLLATVGVLGTGAFLFLLIAGIIYLFKGIFSMSEEFSLLSVGLGSIWIFLTIILLFYIVNMTILFMWWTIFALMVAILAFNPRTALREFSTGSSSSKPSLLFSFIFVLMIVGIVVALYSQGQKYIATRHFNKALVADQKNKDIKNIVQELTNTVMLDPMRDLYYRNRSLAFFAMANDRIVKKGKDFKPKDAAYVSELIKASLADAERAKNINPNDIDNYLALVRVYESLLPTMEGAGDKAIEYAKKAIELDPNNPAIYQRMANIYVVLADLKTSKALANKKDKKKSELPDKAKEYLVLAKDNLNKALQLKDNFLSARLLLVGILEREKNSDEAIKQMETSRKMFPANPGLAFQLGLLYLRNDKIDMAGNQFVQAVRIDPKYANAHFYLGIVFDKKNRKDLAIKEFEKIKELNPDNKLVNKIIENLKAGRSALAGLRGTQTTNNDAKKPTEETKENSPQPSINPEIKNKEIPKEAVPNLNDKTKKQKEQSPTSETNSSNTKNNSQDNNSNTNSGGSQ